MRERYLALRLTTSELSPDGFKHDPTNRGTKNVL